MNVATINDDLTVTITIDGIEVDHSGPWVDRQSAQEWADSIVAALNAGEITLPRSIFDLMP